MGFYLTLCACALPWQRLESCYSLNFNSCTVVALLGWREWKTSTSAHGLKLKSLKQKQSLKCNLRVSEHLLSLGFLFVTLICPLGNCATWKIRDPEQRLAVPLLSIERSVISLSTITVSFFVVTTLLTATWKTTTKRHKWRYKSTRDREKEGISRSCS